MRVLVADDDRDMSQLLCALLRTAGHQPIAVSDAAGALMLAMRAPQPDAIVLDINMPAGTGLGALEKLKRSSKTATIPVLIVSATREPDIAERVVQAGATAFLAKPITPEGFLAAVAALLP